MDRKSKTASVRLSGIFDLFTEPKTGSECQKDSSDEQHNQQKELTAERKKSLFSFRRKKAMNDTKDEKHKGKPISRETHKPEQNPLASNVTSPKDDNADKDETTNVSHMVVLRRTGEILTLNEIKSRSEPLLLQDLTFNSTEMRDKGETANKVKHSEGIIVKQKAIVEPRNSQSGEELSPTQKKTFNMVTKRPKLFRFPSKSKNKPLDDVDFDSPESETLFRQQDREKSKDDYISWGEVQMDKHRSKSKTMAESEVGENRNCYEFSIENRQTIMLAKDPPERWKEFRFVKSEDWHCKTRGDSELHQHDERSSDNDTEFPSKGIFDVLKRLIRNLVCSPLYLVRGLYILIKSLLILICLLVISFLYKIYMYLKSFKNFIIKSFSTVFLIIKELLKSMGQLMPVTRTTQKKVTEGKHDGSRISECEYVNKHEHAVSEVTSASENVNTNDTGNYYSLPNTSTFLLAKTLNDADKHKQKWWKNLCPLTKREKHKNSSHKSVSNEVIVTEEKPSLCMGTQSKHSEDEITEEKPSLCIRAQSKHSEDEIRKFDSVTNNITALLRCLRIIFYLSLSIVLFIPVNMIQFLKFVYSKMFTTVTSNSVKTEMILSGDARITELQQYEECKHSRDVKEKRDKSKIKSTFLGTFCSTKRQKDKTEVREFHVDEYSISDYECSPSSSEIDQTTSINKAPLSACDTRVLSRKIITYIKSMCTNIYSYIQCMACFVGKLVFTLLVCAKIVLQFIVMLPYFVILLIGKVVMFVLQCCCYVIAGVGKLVMFMAKVVCFIFLLILSLPLGIFAFLRLSARFATKICSRCYMSIIRKVKCKSTLNVSEEDENNATYVCKDPCRLSDLSNDTEYKAKEKFQRKWGILSILKKPKNTKKVLLNEEEYEEFSDSESDEQETKLEFPLSKSRCDAKKLKDFILELFLRLISIILLLPLGMFSILSSIFNFFGFFFATASEKIRSFVHPIWKPANRSSGDILSDSNNKCNKGKRMKFFKQLSKSDDKAEPRSSLDSTNEGLVNAMKPSPHFNVLKKYESDTKNDLSQENCSDSEEIDQQKTKRENSCTSRMPLARLKIFLKIFFHLQSIFVSALWNRINIAISSFCKFSLLAALRLTPKTIVKWTLILVCRYTPGIKNRAILLQFLKETPAQVTKSLSEAYLKRVPISVMMTHAEMSLRESPTRKVVRLISTTWISVTRIFEKFFLGISSFFRELSRAFRSKRMRKRDKILLRLSSSERSGND